MFWRVRQGTLFGAGAEAGVIRHHEANPKSTNRGGTFRTGLRSAVIVSRTIRSNTDLTAGVNLPLDDGHPGDEGGI